MGALLSALAGWMGAGLTALFAGWRVFLVVGFMSFLMVYVYNLASDMLLEVLNWVTDQAGAVELQQGQTSVFNFTGFIGYMLGALKIPQCMSFIITIVSLKFMLRKIPFIKW